MDNIIVFFRDVLDGPAYIALCVVCSILICSCIGCLGERYLKRKQQIADKAKEYAQTSNPSSTENGVNNQQVQGTQAEVAAAINVTVGTDGKVELPVEQQQNMTSAPGADVDYGVGLSVNSDNLLDDD